MSLIPNTTLHIPVGFSCQTLSQYPSSQRFYLMLTPIAYMVIVFIIVLVLSWKSPKYSLRRYIRYNSNLGLHAFFSLWIAVLVLVFIKFFTLCRYYQHLFPPSHWYGRLTPCHRFRSKIVLLITLHPSTPCLTFFPSHTHSPPRLNPILVFICLWSFEYNYILITVFSNSRDINTLIS